MKIYSLTNDLFKDLNRAERDLERALHRHEGDKGLIDLQRRLHFIVRAIENGGAELYAVPQPDEKGEHDYPEKGLDPEMLSPPQIKLIDVIRVRGLQDQERFNLSPLVEITHAKLDKLESKAEEVVDMNPVPNRHALVLTYAKEHLGLTFARDEIDVFIEHINDDRRVGKWPTK